MVRLVGSHCKGMWAHLVEVVQGVRLFGLLPLVSFVGTLLSAKEAADKAIPDKVAAELAKTFGRSPEVGWQGYVPDWPLEAWLALVFATVLLALLEGSYTLAKRNAAALAQFSTPKFKIAYVEDAYPYKQNFPDQFLLDPLLPIGPPPPRDVQTILRVGVLNTSGVTLTRVRAALFRTPTSPSFIQDGHWLEVQHDHIGEREMDVQPSKDVSVWFDVLAYKIREAADADLLTMTYHGSPVQALVSRDVESGVPLPFDFDFEIRIQSDNAPEQRSRLRVSVDRSGHEIGSWIRMTRES